MFEQAHSSAPFAGAAPAQGSFAFLWETPSGMAVVFGCLCLAAYALSALVPDTNITSFLLVRQDRWLLLAGFLSLLLAGFRLGAGAAPLRLGAAGLAVLAVALLAFGYLGHYLVLHGYNLSRDEQMADFDAAIFAKGL
ncbi:hypothetical protein, partial [Rhodoblastus sp.]